ncbi:NACHT domain-containing protein [Streptomyces sp. ME02-6987-2C]|uniref:NACHT domain-containing protein n=1 Tax=unclassified Streptomyces TaxID=2593676 RepID=UPI0029A8F49A|nr:MULTISPECIES: NACHT domain-containing protein [unclassified Streptomyces]MDX3370731.1 NACHT domain-containing protein [Streptomyces sp. ME02-6987-2C]MDX3423962.1 NACHT domain-containing protein [Streptomyces sp. ME02-6985-2c]
MVDVTALGARVASSAVVPLVRRLFVRDGPGAGLVDRPVRISALVSFRGEKRNVTPEDVDKIAGELVRRALTSAGPGEEPVDAAEAAAVKDALARTLARLGEITVEDYEAVGLGPERFARELRAGVPLAPYGLGEGGTLLYERLLHTASLHILNFLTQRSTYVARQQTVQTQQLARLVRAVDVLLERLPSQSAEDAGFEESYADHVAARYGTLTIYGLDAGTREWPLDTAYLSLEATRPRAGRDGRRDPEYAAVAAEQVLAGHDQVFLRGVAGSGKTTLVQWLAVTAAGRVYDHGLTHLIGRVPFVLPMRRIVRPGAELPVPGDFLRAVGCPVAGEQPPGWVERVLRARRGVLLVDGIDEIAQDRRAAARRWLRELVRAFPGNLWLVTSRPSAVPEAWLAAEGFSELVLAPMGRDGVATFVRRWHRAAEVAESVGESLLASVRSTSELNGLATNPLMCGMLCALHRDRRGFLPQDRRSLYEAALTMLLERRDRERELHGSDGVRLAYATQVQLLQKLAWWLIRNSRQEMDRDEALGIVDRALPALNLADAGGEEVYRALLLRSGLLREPAEGRVDFLHRTFQDYLGARLAVQEMDFDLLVNHAHLDEWDDVILLALAHARPKEAEQMLRRLTELGTPRGTLLAAAGLRYAAEVAPTVRGRVEDGLATHVPPTTFEAAREVARAGGDLVLGLLPGPEDGIDDGTAARVVHTAVSVGSEAALQFLSRFREHTGADVQEFLATSWNRFDREQYAREILAHLPRQRAVEVATTDDLHVLRSLGGWGHIFVRGAYRVDDLTELVVPERLTHLTLEAPHPVEGLAWLTAFPRLRTVSVLADLDEAVARQVPDGVELQGPFASLSSQPQG